MGASEIIRWSLDFIESTLKAEISPRELAERAGYSLRQFGGLFLRATGLPPKSYIVKRRLYHAIIEISAGRTAADVAAEYGFGSYAGFYKAFVRGYGCSPRRFLALYGKVAPKEEDKMEKKALSEAELRAALASWGLAQDLPIREVMVMGGTKAAGDVWAIGKEYILKAGDRERLQRGLFIANALKAHGFLAVIPIKTSDGAEMTEGKPAFTLTRKLKGMPLSPAKRLGTGREGYGEEYGRGLAKLHLALAAIEEEIQPMEEDLAKQLTGWALPALRLQNEQWKMGLNDGFFEGFAAEIGESLPALPKQLIHRDPNPGNLLFEKGKLSGFIDFELSVRGIRLWDPCYCATGILSEAESLPEAERGWIELLRGILHGYDEINPLTAAEKRSVFPVLCSIQAICISYFESREEFRELAKKSREMLRFIVGVEEKIRQIPS
ncbi:MAG: phosphotransferase [Christensenellaceae bacterium]|jgi:Ser/Thr protein kinase RdoA (MazF antagonist)/AraC-like DNA-binding protein|nr:phosphotransferase [Christensenellaceae bacterium]